jgi:tetratricopeptide (TPR) repeat protein
MKSSRGGWSARFLAAAVLAILCWAIAQAQMADGAEYHLKRGITRYKAGDLDGAIADFTKAIEVNSRPARASGEAGVIRSLAGNKSYGLGRDRVVLVVSVNALAYNNRGIARRAKDDIAGAISDFDAAISINPRLAEAYLNRGAARCIEGNLDGAFTDLNTAIAINSRNALAFNNRGKVHQLKGDLRRAVADYSEAIRLDPTYAMAYANRGLARLWEGNGDEAESDFKRCLALDPKLKPSLYRLIDEIKAAKADKP